MFKGNHVFRSNHVWWWDCRKASQSHGLALQDTDKVALSFLLHILLAVSVVCPIASQYTIKSKTAFPYQVCIN